LIEEQLKVLKVMNEVTNRIDMNAFAQMVGLNSHRTIERVQELVASGFVKKVGGGYGITEKGKTVLQAITPVTIDAAFHFYTAIGQPTGFSAESLKDFYKIVKHIAIESLDFHLYRGDFENWFESVFKDAVLINEVANIKASQLKGEDLRQAILKTLAAKFYF